MANPHKGEVELVVDRKTYKLDLTTNGICEAEREADASYDEIVNTMNRVMSLRALLYGALKEHHPMMTARMAGEIIHRSRAEGSMQTTLAKLLEAISLSKVEPDENAGDPKDP